MNHEELAKLTGEADPVACLGAVISSWMSGRCSKPAIMESLTGALRNKAINGESIAANIEQREINDLVSHHNPPLSFFCLVAMIIVSVTLAKLLNWSGHIMSILANSHRTRTLRVPGHNGFCLWLTLGLSSCAHFMITNSIYSAL